MSAADTKMGSLMPSCRQRLACRSAFRELPRQRSSSVDDASHEDTDLISDNCNESHHATENRGPKHGGVGRTPGVLDFLAHMNNTPEPNKLPGLGQQPNFHARNSLSQLPRLVLVSKKSELLRGDSTQRAMIVIRKNAVFARRHASSNHETMRKKQALMARSRNDQKRCVPSSVHITRAVELHCHLNGNCADVDGRGQNRDISKSGRPSLDPSQEPLHSRRR